MESKARFFCGSTVHYPLAAIFKRISTADGIGHAEWCKLKSVKSSDVTLPMIVW